MMTSLFINLKLYKNEITNLLLREKTILDIVQHLRKTYEIQLVLRMLQRRIRT